MLASHFDTLTLFELYSLFSFSSIFFFYSELPHNFLIQAQLLWIPREIK